MLYIFTKSSIEKNNSKFGLHQDDEPSKILVHSSLKLTYNVQLLKFPTMIYEKVKFF